MKVNELIYKIVACVGGVLAIVMEFIPSESLAIKEKATDTADPSSVWNLVIQNNLNKLFDGSIPLFDNSPWIITVGGFWLPSILIVAALALIFIMTKKKIGLIASIVGAVLFLIFDMLLILSTAGCWVIFVNLIAVIVMMAGMLLYYVEMGPVPIIAGEVTCLRGEYAGATFYVEDEIVIGRSADGCNVVLSNKTVSRIHCIIKYIEETDTYTVKDVSSSGTFLGDGTRLAKNFEMQLKRKSEIHMGNPEEVFLLD